MEPQELTPTPEPCTGTFWTKPQRISVIILVLLCGVWILWRVGSGWSPVEVPHGRPSVQLQIDPNTAPWPQLASLPGIGEKLAQRIVRFREEHSTNGKAFKNAADLDAVPGIGKSTVAELEPYLVFH